MYNWTRDWKLITLFHLVLSLQNTCAAAMPLPNVNNELTENGGNDNDLNINDENYATTVIVQQESIRIMDVTESSEKNYWNYEVGYMYDCSMPTIPPIAAAELVDDNRREIKNVEHVNNQSNYNFLHIIVENVNSAFVEMVAMGQKFFDSFVTPPRSP